MATKSQQFLASADALAESTKALRTAVASVGKHASIVDRVDRLIGPLSQLASDVEAAMQALRPGFDAAILEAIDSANSAISAAVQNCERASERTMESTSSATREAAIEMRSAVETARIQFGKHVDRQEELLIRVTNRLTEVHVSAVELKEEIHGLGSRVESSLEESSAAVRRIELRVEKSRRSANAQFVGTVLLIAAAAAALAWLILQPAR